MPCILTNKSLSLKPLFYSKVRFHYFYVCVNLTYWTQVKAYTIEEYIKKISEFKFFLEISKNWKIKAYFTISVVLGCGGSTSDNSSYLVQASTTSLTSPCKYTICPCSTNICRIRLDFTVSIFKFACILNAKGICKVVDK